MIHVEMFREESREIYLFPLSKIGDIRACLCADEKRISKRGEIDVTGAGKYLQEQSPQNQEGIEAILKVDKSVGRQN